MRKIEPATLKDVIKAIELREYDDGKTRASQGRRDNFYTLFYESLEQPGKAPARVVVEGRAEMFAEMPEGTGWSIQELEPNDFGNVFVINSSGWNGHPQDFSVPERHRAIFADQWRPEVKTRILEMLEHAETTFAPAKMPALITKAETGPWTILEGNHTFIALYHLYLAQGRLALRHVLVGLLPLESSYRFLREGTLNITPTGKHKAANDLKDVHFPQFVLEAIGALERTEQE